MACCREREAEFKSSIKIESLIERERRNIIGHLTEETKGMVHPVLMRGLEVGIGFHKAALHAFERQVVEHAFATGIISALCSTTTLAAGVNLPASRVIIASPWIGREFISCSRYLQMVGRAGRTMRNSSRQENDDKGVDRAADSFVFVHPNDVGRFQCVVDSHIENIQSQLTHSLTYYKRTVHKEKYDATKSTLTGVSRIVIGVLDIAGGMKLLNLMSYFKLTLLYQGGFQNKKEEEEDKGQMVSYRSILPLLQELKVISVLSFHLQFEAWRILFVYVKCLQRYLLHD